MPIVKQRPSHLGKQESGISTLLILLGLTLMLGSSAIIIGNYKASRKAEDSITTAIARGNGERFVLQMISDDELCTSTDFMDGISGFQRTGTVVNDISLKMSVYVDYSGIGVPNLRWPADGNESGYRTSGYAFGSRAPVEGVVQLQGLYFEQPRTSEKEVLVTTLPGKTITRVPVMVWQRGLIDGTPAFFDGIGTYIEFDSTAPNPNAPIACYREISSRSFCRDRGGEFNPAAAVKCVVP